MAMNRKKVVLLIVEGSCEEVLLNNRLRGLFEQHHIRFHIHHGDILYDLSKPDEPIKSVIGNAVKEFMLKSKFRSEDVFCVCILLIWMGVLFQKMRLLLMKPRKS